MSINKGKKPKIKYKVEKGFSENGLPFARIGNNSNLIVNLEALSFTNEPPSGFMLKRFAKPLLYNYTVYNIGRKQNVPEDYTFTDMANDYADMIRNEFKKPVIIVGSSTGGQIAQYLAADHSDVVQKLIIVSAAYRVSEKGAEIESRAAEFFEQRKYVRALTTILELVYISRTKMAIAKLFTRLLGRFFIGKIKYPNDFLTEVKGDIEMNFKDRLGEIKAPTLILCGGLDIEYPKEYVQETAEGIPNAKLKFFEEYGHGLAGRWKVIETDILEFLEE